MHNEICLKHPNCGICAEYGGIHSKGSSQNNVIGHRGVWTTSKYVWMRKGMELPYITYITRLVGMHNEICLNAPNCGICVE